MKEKNPKTGHQTISESTNTIRKAGKIKDTVV
jgi:hypothetical protein